MPKLLSLIRLAGAAAGGSSESLDGSVATEGRLMAVLNMTLAHCNQMRHHAEVTYPDECCGLFLGWRSSDGSTAIVEEVWALPNAWDTDAASVLESEDGVQTAVSDGDAIAPSKRRRYWLDPKDLLKAQRYVREVNQAVGSQTPVAAGRFDVLGVFHSHPDHPAVPSECDRRCAWPEYSYIIVSVQQGQARDLLSWRLDDSGMFQPEAIAMLGIAGNAFSSVDRSGSTAHPL